MTFKPLSFSLCYRAGKPACGAFSDPSILQVHWGWVTMVPYLHLSYIFLCSLSFVAQKLFSQPLVLLQGELLYL